MLHVHLYNILDMVVLNIPYYTVAQKVVKEAATKIRLQNLQCATMPSLPIHIIYIACLWILSIMKSVIQ